MNNSDRQEVVKIIKETLEKAFVSPYFPRDTSKEQWYLKKFISAIETEPEKTEQCKQCANPMLKEIHTCSGQEKCDHEYRADKNGNVYCKKCETEPGESVGCKHDGLKLGGICVRCGYTIEQEPEEPVAVEENKVIGDYQEEIKTLEDKLYDMTYNYGEALQIKDKAEHLMREAQKELQRWKRGARNLAAWIYDRDYASKMKLSEISRLGLIKLFNQKEEE